MGFKVLTAEVSHETNTFNVLHTNEDAFRNRFFLRGDSALTERGRANTELAGFMDIGDVFDWDITHVLSIAAGPSGHVKRAAFDWFCDPIVGRASDGEFDGILLALHGAMVLEFCEDGEGEILRRIRKVVDASVPIAITLDPHANVTAQMVELADIIVSFKTYPHIDMRTIARQAAEILQRAMKREIQPRTVMARVPMLEEVNGGRTDEGPMISRIERALAYEAQNDVFAVSINAGFASADIEEVGPSVLVTGQGDFNAHSRFAQTIADEIWEDRDDVLNRYWSVEDAASYAASYQSEEGALVIADYADNPGAGAYGDSTALLKAVLDARVNNACFGSIVDSQVIEELRTHNIGAKVRIALGGKTDDSFGGGPLDIEVTLVSLWDGVYTGDGAINGGLRDSFGPSAVVRAGGVEVLISSLPRQMLDLQQFKTFGIDPEKKQIVVIKSMQHFRAAFEPISSEIIICDSGAICTPQYQKLFYKNVRRPIYPLDDM